MRNRYQTTVTQILQGDVNTAASEIHSQRDQKKSNDEQIERSLLALRLAMKAGNFTDSPETLNADQTQNIFLKGEICFVQGSYFAMTSQHALAAIAYKTAASHYECSQSFEKQALSLFNQVIASSYAVDLDLAHEGQVLDQVLKLCLQHNISKVEFLCHRHQAYRLYEKAQYQASIDLLLPWVARKEILTKSDSELALLHIADCWWELRDLRQALNYFDQVPAHHDERVRFPKALVEAKIWQKNINIHEFSMVTDHWRSRFLRMRRTELAAKSASAKQKHLRWNQATGILSKGSRMQGKIKQQTLEGRLIRLLMDGPRTKVILCESLWPADMETVFLNDRFHQMVQRVQRKTNGLIEFDGHAYRLTETLKLL